MKRVPMQCNVKSLLSSSSCDGIDTVWIFSTAFAPSKSYVYIDKKH
jgi:hypothetical protein